MWQQFVIKLALWILILQCVSCSARGLLMSHAKFFFIRGVDEYLDLTNTQEAELGRIYDRQVVIFRNDLLPKLNLIADDIVGFFDSNPSPEGLRLLLARADGLRRQLVLSGMDDVGGFFASIREDQIDHFERKLKDTNDDQEEAQQLDDAEYVENRRKRIKKLLERWFGDMGPKESEIFAGFTFSKDWGRRNLDARMSYQKNLVAVMRKSIRSKAAHKEWLERFANNQNLFYDQPHHDLLQERNERFTSSMMRFSRLLSPEQRQHFKESIASLKNDLSRI